MRVTVTLTIDGQKETVIEGECLLFDKRDYRKGYDNSLRDIGFWLSDWRFAGNSSPAHKGRVFIPWGSALYIVEQNYEQYKVTVPGCAI